MTDDPDEMKKEIEQHAGKTVTCTTCGCSFDFDTGEVLNG